MVEMKLAQKDIEAAQEASVQPRATEPVYGGLTGFMNYLHQSSYRVAPWWSPQRDVNLESFVKDSDHVSSSLSMLVSKVSTVPVQVLPRDNRIRRHQEDAEQFNIILNEEAEYGQSWTTAISKWLQDYWCADNGAFLEIIGDGKKDGPVKGPSLGIAHLDSFRCTRTGDPDYPVVYSPPAGGLFKLHRTRVAYASDMPSAREEMLDVGFCAISRMLNNAQVLMDILNFKQEKLGSRPHRGILQGRGISTDTIISALKIANEAMDSKGLGVYAQLAILGGIAPDAGLDLIDLISLPDGFNEEQSIRLGMFCMALAFNVPIRWIWPAATSGATKADAMYQHIAGLGGGIGKVLHTLTLLLGGDPRGSRHSAGKFLPPHLKLSFDFQDDEQDKSRADVSKTRAETRNSNLESGVITERVAREQALADNDITQPQFDRMELQSGRMPGGEPVMSLFLIDKEPYLSWLDLGVPNPLAISVNDPIDMLAEIDAAAVRVQDVLANSGQANQKARAEMTLGALNQLKTQYAPLAQQSVQQDIMARLQGNAPTPTEQVEEEETLPPDTVPLDDTLAEEEKMFDYGASVGEIIGGELARGEGGRYINAQDMMNQLRAGMLERMRGATSDIGTNSAASKRSQNRALIAEQLGIDPNLLEGLAGMKTGEASQEQMQALAGMGFAEIQSNGDITMNAAGRSMLSATNSGNVDAAKIARAKAQNPKGGGGRSSKPKVSAEERRQQREEQARQERERNRQTVAESVSARLPQDDFNALDRFNQGEDLLPAEQQRLAQAGLVEMDAEGNARMTSQGSRFMSAAEKGNVRVAKDLLSQATEKVRDKEAKVQDYQARATAAQTNSEADAQRYKQTAEQYRTDMAKVISNMQTEAQQFSAQANDMQLFIDTVTDPQERQQAIEQQATLRDEALQRTELAEQTRKAIGDEIERLERMASEALEKGGETYERYTQMAQQLQQSIGGGTVPEAESTPAPEDNEEFLDSINQKPDDDLLASIGLEGLPLKSFLQKLFRRGKKQPFIPQGQPLEEESDLETYIKLRQPEAIEEWNESRRLPNGILEAEQATEEQIGEVQ